MNPHQYLSQGLRLGTREAGRRVRLTENIGSLSNFQGETLPPRKPATAAAVADGCIGAEHALVISAVLAKVPGCISPEVKARAEAELAAAASGLNPDDLGKVGDRLLAHLDPDGQESDHVDRQRQRGLTILPQDRQLMSRVRGAMTPELRAKFEVILTAWAAPGMNNPADPESPTGAIDSNHIDADALAGARSRDLRSAAQRTHDALLALCDWVLGHVGLGRPDRIPAELVITVTDQELAAHAGISLTATGTRVPIGELVSLAADAVPHLAVFRNHTSEVLYQGRGARFAAKAQRLALFARDRGCTAPGCDRPFAQTQAHHSPDWITAGGRTDIDALGAACGRHNRAVGTSRGQWETTVLTDGPDTGRMAWRPATGSEPWRLNPTHHAGQAHHLHPPPASRAAPGRRAPPHRAA
ncbi:hypothetical protein GSI01S_18_00330 [Gordonia sihwensis NBRC 108236]|uniref:DUF222 domain-containing protein n=1 Tax=Gordonia sihwensis NBRC 108236 TaxID=1223544 RepID=L7LN09_9ACTN|nr:hypothetical protein UG54_08125 [Gordonia sihwensis]GAC61472.1 hypothetical protein GSI01S_18_00330 [Gordonia sihwensis NBRC 108236]